MVLARIKTLVYGTADPKAGAAGSVMNIVRHKKLNHRIKVLSGTDSEASGRILKNFFKEMRKKSFTS
jgi:tRNA(adenine34) deaminase